MENKNYDVAYSLKNMNDEEFRQFTIFYSGYTFSKFLLQERIEHNNNDTFVVDIMASIVMDTLLNPLRQVLGRYDDLIKASTVDRWEHITNNCWDAWIKFKNIYNDGRTGLGRKQLFEELFFDEWERICKGDKENENNTSI